MEISIGLFLFCEHWKAWHRVVISLSSCCIKCCHRFVIVLSSLCYRAVIVSGVERLVRQCNQQYLTKYQLHLINWKLTPLHFLIVLTYQSFDSAHDDNTCRNAVHSVPQFTSNATSCHHLPINFANILPPHDDKPITKR